MIDPVGASPKLVIENKLYSVPYPAQFSKDNTYPLPWSPDHGGGGAQATRYALLSLMAPSFPLPDPATDVVAQLPGGGLDGPIARMRFSGLAQVVQTHFLEAKSFEVGGDRKGQTRPTENSRTLRRDDSGIDDPARRAAARDARSARDIGYHLAHMRKQQGITQAQVAAAMGVSQVRVSRMEHGDVEKMQVESIAAYVAAIGGHLRLVADFGQATTTFIDYTPMPAVPEAASNPGDWPATAPVEACYQPMRQTGADRSP